MTQEDKKLLLKDLSARLTYGVLVQHEKCKNAELKLVAVFNDGRIGVEENGIGLTPTSVDMCKPYLRPISSMTDEEMDRLFDILHIDKDGKDDDWIKINDVYGIKFFFPTGKWVEDVAGACDYLYSIHIDFRGLIPKGLAIEVTEENNPYKE